ncbi:MFS-type transporter SLC18B1-like [Limulus polyphemus]|uniref:MFS-type transporter SLC18B1-like n=1 Tax=Limulus polyphemus TaxID=6850 RepID=A0ABM1TCC4_LIMPO|nr:MFS-type transporter SLC18B1-like [Limulus polyphemus]
MINHKCLKERNRTLSLSSAISHSFLYLAALHRSLARGYPNDHTTYGLLSGVFQASSSLGAFVGPSVGGILLEHVGYRMSTAVLVAEELVLIGVLIIYTFYNMATSKKVVDDEKRFLLHKPTSST